MKKIISLLMSLVMLVSVFSCFTLPTNASESSNSIERYSVLILDDSGSMSGKPMTVQKQSAKKFCNSVLKSKGKNRVAIIRIDSPSSKLCDFTDDLSLLTSKIDSLSANGGTNIYSALSLAEDLLDSAPKNAIKNLVVCSDGLPCYGKTESSGKYTSDDNSEYYAYANAVYNKSHDLMDKYDSNFHMYSLGFFHSLSDDELIFGRAFMNDIQNSGYYEVTNVDDLEFNFGEIVDDIVSDGKDKDPIIVIPGTMGSKLYLTNWTTDDMFKVWDPDPNILGVAQLNKYISGDLYVKDCEKQNDLSENQREYGSVDTYKYLVNQLCKKFPNRPVYFFSYDWRQDNRKSAKELIKAINSIIDDESYKCDKVDLVCHSMGGFVASSCYSQLKSKNQESKLDKIITCGTPYEGAPATFNSVLNWDILGEGAFGKNWLEDDALGLIGGLTKEVKGQFLGVAQLVPTKEYISKIPMQQSHVFNHSNLNYSQYKNKYKDVFKNSKKIEPFQNSIRENGYNVLLNYDKAYFAIGKNEKTIQSVRFSQFGTDISHINYSNQGDGTVPYYSASICKKIKKIDPSRVCEKETTHGGLVSSGKNTAVHWVCDILNNGKSNELNSTTVNKKLTVVRIACPVEVSVSKNGNTIKSNGYTKKTSDFGRIDIVGSDNEIKYVCVDTDVDYNVVLNATGSGTMDYSVSFFDENENLVDEREFISVPLNDKMVIKTSLDENKKTVLNVDSDGDNKSDTIISASKNETIDLSNSNSSVSTSNTTEIKPNQSQNNSTTSTQKLSIKKLVSKRKALVVYWNKIANVSGYQIQVATDKKFKKNKKTVTVAKQNASKKTVKKLKAKKKYFVRVRAYKTVNGKKSYGKWSKIKSVKTK